MEVLGLYHAVFHYFESLPATRQPLQVIGQRGHLLGCLELPESFFVKSAWESQIESFAVFYVLERTFCQWSMYSEMMLWDNEE